MGTRIRPITELDLAGRRVFIRVDFNVPVDEAGQVTDDTRIQATLPTLQHARDKGARIILASHLGQPKGKPSAGLSLVPVAERLAELCGCEVLVPDECVGDGPRKLVRELREDRMMLLENLRFHPGETANDEAFAKQLAGLADCYVNDAFGAAHRKHASVCALPALMPERAAGLLMARELEVLGKLMEAPQAPFVAVLGGAKVSSKIGVIEGLLPKVDKLLVGGAMAYTFLAAQGIAVGRSLVEEDQIAIARRTLLKADKRRVELLLPVDHVVASEVSDGAETRIARNGDFAAAELGVDIGPETAELFAAAIGGARTVFWNGPMGVFEVERFAAGTYRIAQAVARSGAKSVVGGGDSVAALKKSGFLPFIDHVSTGGGASLELLEGLELPGVESLRVPAPEL